MRNYLSLPALAIAALLGFSTVGARAGRFFGPASYGDNYGYQYPNRSNNSFDYGPCSQCQAGRPPFRHSLFHRDKRVANDRMPANIMPAIGTPAVPAASGLVANDRMPANVMPAYAMPPVYGVPIVNVQTPIVQSPIQTLPVHMTSVAPVPLPVAPAVQYRPCSKCGQSGQAPVPVPTAPVVQSRLVPIPTPIRSGPTTAEPPQAEPSGIPPS
jgi:hypothetical protein